ncbi:MAG: GNAT family N-acetyltransferase [Candidatus Cloacimonetes bacterium]|nr:GNAT family N-acetyltransferase [Candidatus Cloacimonadota bacterium]
MKYYRKLIGDKCYLSPINMDDAPKYTEWLNDMEIIQYLDIANQQLNLEKERIILEEMIKKGNQIFAIVLLETDELIGNCSLFDIDQRNRSAELGIFIGEKKYWNRGYGTEAIRLLLDYGFNILNMNNILLEVYSYNEKGLHTYEKAGFKIIGRRREAKYMAGKYWDIIFMDITAAEFASIYIKKVFAG